MSNDVLILDNGNFDSTISEGVTMVDFWAEWCGPCKMMLPYIDGAAEDLMGKAKVAKVNVDDNENLAARFGIMSIPTVIIFKDGMAKEKMIGLRQKSALVGAVSKYL